MFHTAFVVALFVLLAALAWYVAGVLSLAWYESGIKCQLHALVQEVRAEQQREREVRQHLAGTSWVGP